MIAQVEMRGPGAILDEIPRNSVLRAHDLRRRGLPGSVVKRLVARGRLLRLGRGLYCRPDVELTQWHDLAEVCARVPNGVICLSSALQFHNLTTQSPSEVWMMIQRGAWQPRIQSPPVRVFHASGEAFHAGIEEHLVEGVTLRVYTPAKTVADCFKYRNKIGLDVALEALRECLRERRCSRDELHDLARVCRVERVMRPYLEALT